MEPEAGGSAVQIETLELEDEEDLGLTLVSLGKEQLEELHKTQSFKIGSAVTGVLINGVLTCVYPSHAVGTKLSIGKLCQAIRRRRSIEKAAKELGVDFRKGEGPSRLIHDASGPLVKTSLSLLFLGQDDFVAAADFWSPDDVQIKIKDASKIFYQSKGVSKVVEARETSVKEAKKVLKALDHELPTDKSTWEKVQ